jgi:DNA end-binding protein Ku
MRAVWKGSVSFGLVNIPIALYSATRSEDVRFKQLRKSDLSPIRYQRVAEADGKEVPWEEIVKGYEYEKGHFVVMSDEDFERVDVEATQSIDIIDFVELEQVNPMFFQKPYYLEPQKGGDKAYALLRDTLKETGKTGIAKVVIKTRQYLAALKPQDDLLVLQLLHFADELAAPDKLNVPRQLEISKKEIETAKALVENLTVEWEPERYHDEYRSALMELIEEKVAAGGKQVATPAAGRPRKATNVVDLVKVLQESLAQAQKESGKAGKKAPAKAKPASPRKRKPAASRTRRKQTA